MYTGKLKVVQGKLVHTRISDKEKYDRLIKSLPEGTEIEVYMDLVTDDGSLAQIAKVHAMIRDIANFTGNSVAGTKLLVKKEASLCFVHDEELVCKSFGDCSKDELGLAIQACIDIGIKIMLKK